MLTIKFNPHLFEGGTGAGAGTGASGASSGQAAAAPSDENTGKVIYGKQLVENADAAGQQSEPSTTVTSDTAEERKIRYQNARAEFKAEFDADVQQIINRRFKDMKNLEASNGRMQQVMDMLAARYGVDASDSDAVMQAINEDEGFYEEAAQREGLTVAQYKEMSRLQRENETFRQQQEQAQQHQQAQQQMDDWMRQADALTQKYPGFDFATELQNPEMGKLLTAGVPVETAYLVLHNDELIQGAMYATANNVAAATAQNIAARGQRPRENGATSQSSAVVKSDVHKLSRADRAEIARRVLMGENISF